MPYLEIDGDDVLEAFTELWLLESRSKAGKGRVRENSALLWIKMIGGKSPDCVIMLAELRRSSEVDASNGYARCLCKLNPYCSGLAVRIGIVWSHDLSFLLT